MSKLLNGTKIYDRGDMANRLIPSLIAAGSVKPVSNNRENGIISVPGTNKSVVIISRAGVIIHKTTTRNGRKISDEREFRSDLKNEILANGATIRRVFDSSYKPVNLKKFMNNEQEYVIYFPHYNHPDSVNRNVQYYILQGTYKFVKFETNENGNFVVTYNRVDEHADII